MNKVYLGLGSNLGNKVGNIRRAVAILKRSGRIQNVELSSFYKTDPVGKTDQDWFVNAVAGLETSLSARELLDLCLEVETALERVRDERWGPRTLDIDILFYGASRFAEESLRIPHPRIWERAFVLRPLLELDARLAWEGVALSEALDAVRAQGIERMESVVAIFGASEKPERYANMAQRLLMEEGYRLALVAPRGESILGVPVDRTLAECGASVDTVTLYVGSARIGGVLPDLLQAMPRRVIFNPGTENQVAREELEASGIETLEACTLVMLRTGQF